MHVLPCPAVPSGNTVLVDSSQEYKPFWWPPFLPPRVMWCAPCSRQPAPTPALQTLSGSRAAPCCGAPPFAIGICGRGAWRGFNKLLRRPCASAAVRHSGTSGLMADVVWVSWCPRDVCSGSRRWVCGRPCMRGLLVLVHFCRSVLWNMTLVLAPGQLTSRLRMAVGHGLLHWQARCCLISAVYVNTEITHLDILARGSVALEQGVSYWAWNMLFTRSMYSRKYLPMQPVLVAGTTSSSRSQTDPVGTHHSGTPGDPL